MLKYAKYRETMRAATPPMIPYIGVTLSDLTFIDEANPDTHHDLCNFQKCCALADSIREFLDCQVKGYDFRPKPLLQKYFSFSMLYYSLLLTSSSCRYILEFKGFSEDDAYAVSQDIEPRNANSPSTAQPSSIGHRRGSEALIGEIGLLASSPPPQQIISTNLREGDDQIPFLDLRGEVRIKLLV